MGYDMDEPSILLQLKKSNRMLAVMSNVNSMVLHIKDKDKIFAEACRIAVDEGKFRMSWIGIADEKTRILNPVKWAGAEEGYLKKIPAISIDDVPSGRGPSGTAYREARTYVNNDFLHNPNSQMWHKLASDRGFASSIAIPIIVRNKPIGTFTIYASEANFFKDLEVQQLESITANMAFALEAIENAEELARYHDRYASLLNDMREGLQLISFDYRYLFVNPTVIAQSKSKKEDLVGRTMMECFPGIEKTEMFSKLRVSMNKRIPQTFENEFSFPDGTKEWFELRISPVPEGVLILSMDVTERKKVEVALLQSTKDRADELILNASKMSALGEMASGIAHEINNPLSIIVMQATQLLRKHQLHELEQKTFEDGLTKIAATAQRIGKVVKGLRAISRNPENDPMKEVNVSTVIEDTIQLCVERLSTYSIELKQDYSGIANVNILGRSPQIMQVLLNLLNNAVDAVLPLEEKWIEIKASKTDKAVVIKVIDSGHGINDHLLSKIMHPFFTTKEPGKGTGLGLSISKGIIDEHRGELYYQKNYPNTCFVIELPILKKSESTEK